MPSEIIVNESIFEYPQELDRFSYENLEHYQIQYIDLSGGYTDLQGVTWQRTEVYEELGAAEAAADAAAAEAATGYTNTTTYSNNNGYLYQYISGYDYTTNQSINLEKITDINGIVWTKEQQWIGSDITTLTNNIDLNYQLTISKTWGWNDQFGEINTIQVSSTDGNDYEAIIQYRDDLSSLIGSIVIDGQLLHNVSLSSEETMLYFKISGTALDSSNNLVNFRNKSLYEQALVEFKSFDEYQATLNSRYTAIDLNSDVVLDENGQFNFAGDFSFSMHYDYRPLSGWDVDTNKDGNDAVAFKQFNDNFVTIVQNEFNGDTQAYVNGLPAELEFNWETGELENIITLESNSLSSMAIKIIDQFGSEVLVSLDASLSGIELRIIGQVTLPEGEIIPGVDSVGVDSIDITFKTDGDGDLLESYGSITLVEGDVLSFDARPNLEGYLEFDINFEGDILIPEGLGKYIDSNNIDHVNLHVIFDEENEKVISASFDISTLEGSDLLISGTTNTSGMEYNLNFSGDAYIPPPGIRPYIDSSNISNVEITAVLDNQEDFVSVSIYIVTKEGDNLLIKANPTDDDGMRYEFDFEGEYYIPADNDDYYYDYYDYKPALDGLRPYIDSSKLSDVEIVVVVNKYEELVSVDMHFKTIDNDDLLVQGFIDENNNVNFIFEFKGSAYIPDPIRDYITHNITSTKIELLMSQTQDQYGYEDYELISGAISVTSTTGVGIISATPTDDGSIEYNFDFSGDSYVPANVFRPYIDSSNISDVEINVVIDKYNNFTSGRFMLQTKEGDNITINATPTNGGGMQYMLDFEGEFYLPGDNHDDNYYYYYEDDHEFFDGLRPYINSSKLSDAEIILSVDKDEQPLTASIYLSSIDSDRLLIEAVENTNLFSIKFSGELSVEDFLQREVSNTFSNNEIITYIDVQYSHDQHDALNLVQGAVYTKSGQTIALSLSSNGEVVYMIESTQSQPIEWEYITIEPTVQVDDTLTTQVPTQLIQIRNTDTITKARASIDEYGTDYTDGDSGKLMKFELWLDATELSSFGVGATEIRGYQFDINWNDLEVGALNFPTIAGTNVGFNAANPANAGITFNSTNGSVAMANSTAIVDTDISNDGPPSFLGTEVLIGTFYMNPNADLETMSLSIDNMLIVTDTDNINPTNYTTVLEISSVDATIQTDTTNHLDNITLNYFKDGLDTGISTLVEGGDITFPATGLAFDVVKLSDPAAYTSGIVADDAVDILRDIVFLDELVIGSAAWHSADVNNDGVIAADDAVAILRHIVHLDTIDTFDLIDNTTGNRISSLDTNAIDVGQWSIVANGDVDQSGGFGDGYVINVDIV